MAPYSLSLSFSNLSTVSYTVYTIPSSTNFILCVKLSFSNDTGITNILYNGNSVFTNTSDYTSQTSYNFVNYGIGGYPPQPCKIMKGTISSVILYNSLLSDTDRYKVEGYLAWKWCGGGSILPNGHPYSTMSPWDVGVQFNPKSVS